MTRIRCSLLVALLSGITACGGGAVPASTVAATPTAVPPTPTRTFHVASDGVAGYLFLPPDAGGRRSRAVLMVGGSEGGLRASAAAAAVAGQGFVVLQVGYFHVPDEPSLPSTLADVPLEYFATAAQLLAKQPEVDPAHVVVWGTSRGSEAAGLLAGDYPDLVHGAVLSSPSSVAGRGIPDYHQSAWTLHGKPVPTYPLWDKDVTDPTDAPNAYLPVDKINGPIVTICGKLDPIWDSCSFSAVIARRAGQARVTALSYPDAGHSPVEFGAALAAGGTVAELPGGSPATDIAAERDALPRITAVLNAS